MRFVFVAPGRIVFGEGTIGEAAPLVREVGRHPLIITGRAVTRAAPLLVWLEREGISHTILPVVGEPSTETIRLGIEKARDARCDMIISIGGGSVLDTGKALALLLTNGGDPLDYLEVVGRGLPLTKGPMPYMTIPTTASGAEVTRNAVLFSPEHRVKASLRSRLLVPRVVLIDPELTYTVPPEVTANTGLDAIAQVVEPYVSVKANPMTDALCREGMTRAARSLRRVYEKGDDREARRDMCLAGLLGGLALSNAGLGAVHGFAGVIGGIVSAPHGAICGALLPHVTAVNIRALERRSPGDPGLKRYEEIARVLTGNAGARAGDGTAWLQKLCADLRIPSLAALGVRREDLPVIIDKASVARSMKGNPVELTRGAMEEILERAL
ncbi:MAG: iron-containing alcohol dehydrogenase [Deltaproteobacteria bacterium]|nr:iron-containing alcohol dehydrogenase [Deltaproteobacteria bacterium]MBW2120589.1 iron-containing alcohol dehydrogenase [Deltaproteobacteria bacterium]